MTKTIMKVTIGGKTIIVSGTPEIEAIMDILIFGVEGGRKRKEIASKDVVGDVVMVYGPGGPKLKKRERKLVSKKRIFWADSDIEKLREYAKDGMPIVKMGIMFDMKSYNVSNKLRSLHLLKTRKDAEKRKKMNEKDTGDRLWGVHKIEKNSIKKETPEDLDSIRKDFREKMKDKGFNY